MTMNNHQMHLEELAITHGGAGIKRARDIVRGVLSGEADIRLKIDGSPSFVVGKTSDGTCWVSTKSALSKNPKYYGLEHELGELDPSLARKLRYTYINFPYDKIPPGSMAQGDFLFMSDLPTTSFHPNIIEYTFPSPIDQRIGVFMHTFYPDMNDPTIHEPLSMKSTADMYIMPNEPLTLVDTSGINTKWMDERDVLAVEPLTDKETDIMIRAMNNRYRNPDESFTNFVKRIYEKKIESVKTAAAMQRHGLEMIQMVNLRMNRDALILVGAHMVIGSLKHEIMSRIVSPSLVATHVINTNGKRIPCKHEGFVIRHGDEMVKFVDRNEFSRHNFSSNYMRGWDKPTRK